MDRQEIRIGEVVYLNSGSPKLVVVRADLWTVKVSWMSGEVVQSAEFPTECVRFDKPTE